MISPARESGAENKEEGGSHTRPASREAAKAITIRTARLRLSFMA
jgi:hypothetical protein